MAKRQRKITIGEKGFPVQGLGYLEAGKTYPVPFHIAEYCVKKMRSAIYCKSSKQKARGDVHDTNADI